MLCLKKQPIETEIRIKKIVTVGLKNTVDPRSSMYHVFLGNSNGMVLIIYRLLKEKKNTSPFNH